MKKEKSKVITEVIAVRLYGIFNVKTRKLVKVSLDQEEIEMDYALTTDKDLALCECPVTLMF